MNTRLLGAWLSAFLLLCSAGTSQADYSVVDLVKLVTPAVVTVLIFDNDGQQLGWGSGFFVDKTHVITNWHVISGASSARVRLADGKTYAVEGISARDAVADVVSLEVHATESSFSPLKLSLRRPRVGESAVVVGTPLQLELEYTVATGIVSGMRQQENGVTLVQISVPISHGNSGSPVLNLDGEVMGVARSSIEQGQNLNFAVSAEHVRALKPGQPVPIWEPRPKTFGTGPRMPESGRPSKEEWLNKIARVGNAVGLFREVAAIPAGSWAWKRALVVWIGEVDNAISEAEYMGLPEGLDSLRSDWSGFLGSLRGVVNLMRRVVWEVDSNPNQAMWDMQTSAGLINQANLYVTSMLNKAQRLN